jgi:hypothetical protein
MSSLKFVFDAEGKSWVQSIAPKTYEQKLQIQQKAQEWWSTADLADTYTTPNWSIIAYKWKAYLESVDQDVITQFLLSILR